MSLPGFATLILCLPFVSSILISKPPSAVIFMSTFGVSSCICVELSLASSLVYAEPFGVVILVTLSSPEPSAFLIVTVSVPSPLSIGASLPLSFASK